MTIPFIVAVFSITIVIVFENMGILYGQMEAIGKVKEFEGPFKVAGISNIIAGVFGTSPTIVAAENFSGISQGAKSKVAAFTSAILFLLSIFLIPVLKLIPNGVISSVLIFVGILMIQTFFDIERGFNRFNSYDNYNSYDTFYLQYRKWYIIRIHSLHCFKGFNWKVQRSIT